jgi:TetR/AcrR family transcriptional regulator, transcriptional repressor for nem operon
MARKIEFDYEQAIGRATQVFWKRGYNNASLRELLTAMDIGEGSFYNLIKSKKELFLLCLANYSDTVGRRRVEPLRSGLTVRESLEAYFTKLLDELDNPRIPRICMLAGSLSNEVLAERDLKRTVLKEMTAFTDFFVECFDDGKSRGELAPDFDSMTAAQTLVTFLQGLFRVYGVLQTRQEVEKQFASLLKAFELDAT